MIDLLFAAIAAAMNAGTAEAPEEAAPDAAAAPPPAAAAALTAEPQVPDGRFTTAAEVRPILTATKANWIAVRDFGGQDLIYVTHLWAWRCGLLQLEVAVNGGAAAIWPLPACHTDLPQPNSILEDDGLPYRGYAAGSVERVDVRIIYDDLSEDQQAFGRAGLLPD
jgi:hypothetical protein